VKTNVGHLITAAGVAGLIKTVPLKHKSLPPACTFHSPIPRFSQTVPSMLIPRSRNGRTAGLLAGLESVPLGLVAPMPMLFSKKHLLSEIRPAQLLVLSAKTSSALDAATANLVEHLKQHPISTWRMLLTPIKGRRTFNHRRILVRDH